MTRPAGRPARFYRTLDACASSCRRRHAPPQNSASRFCALRRRRVARSPLALVVAACCRSSSSFIARANRRGRRGLMATTSAQMGGAPRFFLSSSSRPLSTRASQLLLVGRSFDRPAVACRLLSNRVAQWPFVDIYIVESLPTCSLHPLNVPCPDVRLITSSCINQQRSQSLSQLDDHQFERHIC